MKQILVSEELLRQVLEALNVYAAKAEHKRTHLDNCQAEEAIAALRTALEQQAVNPSFPQIGDFKNWTLLAGRALDDCFRVIETIEPESTSEERSLSELNERVSSLVYQALTLNGMLTRRQMDEAAPQAQAPVHPRHPVVVKWRNDGIEACAGIADAYGNADAARDMRAMITAPQAQQPPRIGSGVTVEQTLEQWEHDFNNPMTPEQQADWVKREREFASAQAQQPAPVQEPIGYVRMLSGEVTPDDDGCVFSYGDNPYRDTYGDEEWEPVFIAAQQPRKAVKLTHEQAKALAMKYSNDPLHLIFQTEVAVLKKNGVTE